MSKPISALGPVLAAAIWLLGSEAHAQARDPIRVSYSAPAHCGSAQRFETELAERIGEGWLARERELARTLRVIVEATEAGYSGRLMLVNREGDHVTRELSAPTCEQAFSAMVLVAALAVQAQRSAESSAETSEEPEATSPSDVPPESPEPTPPLPPARSLPAGPSEPHPPWEVAIVAEARTGVGPGWAPGAGLSVRSPWAIALGVAVRDSLTRQSAGADVRFSQLAVRLEACPWEPELADGIRGSPCAGLEGGAHRGSAEEDGDRVVAGRRETLGFAQGFLAPRLRIEADTLRVQAGPELGIALKRNEFVLSRPDQEVYRSPLIAVGLALSLGLAL